MGEDTDRAEPRLGLLPDSLIGGHERRAFAVFGLEAGQTLALQVRCTLGEAIRVTVLASCCQDAPEGWDTARAIAIDLPLSAPLSLDIAPVLLNDTPDNAQVAWPLETGGVLIVSAGRADIVPLPEKRPMTALSSDRNGALQVAVAPDETGSAGILLRDPDGAWTMLAHSLPCAAGETVTALALFGKAVYAARANAAAGFDLLRCNAAGAADAAWQPVITRGAWRYGASPAVSTMRAIGDRLFVAADGAQTVPLRIGDEHPEILTVAPDGSWELFSGQPRFSPEGLQQPRTAGGPGTPDLAGLTIGGMDGTATALDVWLRPRDPSTDSAVLLRWRAETDTWVAAQPVPVRGLAVTSMVDLPEGVLVATGADCVTMCIAPGHAEAAGDTATALLRTLHGPIQA